MLVHFLYIAFIFKEGLHYGDEVLSLQALRSDSSYR